MKIVYIFLSPHVHEYMFSHYSLLTVYWLNHNLSNSSLRNKCSVPQHLDVSLTFHRQRQVIICYCHNPKFWHLSLSNPLRQSAGGGGVRAVGRRVKGLWRWALRCHIEILSIFPTNKTFYSAQISHFRATNLLNVVYSLETVSIC